MIFNTPLLALLVTLILTLLFVLIAPRTDSGLAAMRVVSLWGSLISLAIGIWLGLIFDKASAGYQFMSSTGFVGEYNSSFALGVDGLSYVFLLLTLFTFPFLFLAAWNVTKFPNHFLAHLVAMEILLVLTFVTVDLFYFFVLFESLLIPMFLLIGGWGARTRKIKAAYYFFLYTLFGSLFMLFGMIYLYQLTGSLNYYVLLAETLDLKTQKLIWLCFFLAFAVKMPLFPFHIWLPEAHVEAPTVGSMLLASLLLKLGGYGLLRFSLTFLGSASIVFAAAVATLAIAGVIYGSLSTLRQIDLKRIIAYSSVAHMNLVALGIFSFNRLGLDGSIYLMVAHGVVSAALFFCVGVIYDRTHTRLLRYYGGLVTVMPLFASLFFMFNLANMGFPGTPNFIGELLLLAGVYKLAPAISFPSTTGVVFSAAYSTLLQARICFGTLKTVYICNFTDVNRRELTILVGLLGAGALLGLRTDLVLSFTEVVVWNISHYNVATPDVSAAAASLLTPTAARRVLLSKATPAHAKRCRPLLVTFIVFQTRSLFRLQLK
jgi:NADH-quinone oxidoreductase subunit M